MPYVSDTEWTEYKKKIDTLVKDVEELKERFKSVKGASPTIQASAGKRFDLNENLNVITLLRRVSDIEGRLTILETP
jgi:hypothetical protein